MQFVKGLFYNVSTDGKGSRRTKNMANNEKNDIAKRIKSALYDADMTQTDLAKELGLSQAQVNYWVVGHRKPTAENLQKIANVLDKPLEYFLTTKKETAAEYVSRVATKITLIPIVGTSSATNEKFILEEQEGYLPITKSSSKQFAVKVEGNCMVDPNDPANSIYDGNYIIVDPEATVTNGDVVLARISRDYSTIKRIFIKPDCVKLIPDNPKCKTLIKKKEDIEVIGKVVHVFRPVKRKKERA